MPEETKLLTPPAASTPQAVPAPQPLRIAETPQMDPLPVSVAGLRSALLKERADTRRLEEIVSCQRRANQRLREAGLSQSREIVQLRDQLKDNGLEPAVKL